MVKRIMLTMADELYGALEKKRAEFGYMTVQETINDIIRQRILVQPLKKKSKAGRPRKVDDPLIAAFARKR